MIEYAEERFEWIPGPREFRRVEDDLDTLIDLRPLRPDVSHDRLATGWSLLTTMHLEENAKLYAVDLWFRAPRPPQPIHSTPE